MTEATLTHIGGPTMLIEVGGWRLLTDPTFDAPGRRYTFGWGSASRKVTGPALEAASLPPVDAVLLSHDHHGDNLDGAGRDFLPSAGRVITTLPGAKRLGLANAVGLAPWATTRLEAPGRPTIEVVAAPGRHGPPLSRPIVGSVIGFVLRWEGQENGSLWITGDTVAFAGLREVGKRFSVGTVVLHLGGVRFPISGPVRFTMTARPAATLLGDLHARTVIPVHYEGWSHFRQGRAAAEREFAAAPEEVRRSVRWLPIGAATTITV